MITTFLSKSHLPERARTVWPSLFFLESYGQRFFLVCLEQTPRRHPRLLRCPRSDNDEESPLHCRCLQTSAHRSRPPATCGAAHQTAAPVRHVSGARDLMEARTKLHATRECATATGVRGARGVEWCSRVRLRL